MSIYKNLLNLRPFLKKKTKRARGWRSSFLFPRPLTSPCQKKHTLGKIIFSAAHALASWHFGSSCMRLSAEQRVNITDAYGEPCAMAHSADAGSLAGKLRPPRSLARLFGIRKNHPRSLALASLCQKKHAFRQKNFLGCSCPRVMALWQLMLCV